MEIKKFSKSLFVFRRDLRLDDNTGLIESLKKSDEVIPIFILNPAQIEKNEYKSNSSVQFMFDSLEELNENLQINGSKLFLFYGEPKKIIENLINKEKIEAVYFNKDYTPFSKKRDEEIKNICIKNKVKMFSFHDVLINNPDEVLKDNREPYTVFTPYFRKASTLKVKNPEKNIYKNYYKNEIKYSENYSILKKLLKERNENVILGGRKEAIKILKNITDFSAYEKERDIPALEKTTLLSAHLKFGTCSPREVHEAVTNKLSEIHPLIRQLYWRDFFYQIAHHFPHVFEKSFNEKYEKIKWEYNENKFSAWKNGMTGFPIVDAGMRQLNQTGYMHNRVRMIVASFLTKDLHIDWRLGEKYFAQKLVDYDPCINNGNWQWAASTGCDAQPYFRIFNPWLQQKRFDYDAKYIKKWVPELKELSSSEIHELNAKQPTKLIKYPRPIISHDEEKIIALKMFNTN